MENVIMPFVIAGVVILILVVIPRGLFVISDCLYERHMEKNHRLYPEYYETAKRRNEEFETAYSIDSKIRDKKEKIDELLKKLDYTPMEHQEEILVTIEELRQEIYPMEIVSAQHLKVGRELREWMDKYREEHNIKE